MDIDPQRLRQIVQGALDEDVGSGDVTTEATIPADLHARGVLLAKEEIVLAGLDAAAMSFNVIDPQLSWEPRVKDGDLLPPSTVLAFVRGRARSLLTAERVALNFLQRLSGVATLTQKFVTAVAGTRAKIRDTRKTTPLLRFLEKKAVELGGGEAHRGGLDAALLVKDNHVRLAGSVDEATRRALAAARGLSVEIEVDRPDQIEVAIGAGAQMILLDNFTVEAVRAAVEQVNGRVPVEVSGGIKLENVRLYAEAGPDYIAVGALTHSAPAVDISLEIESD